MHKLPVQLLARILQCLEPDTRLLLSCALVSRTWRTATALAVRHITVSTNCTQPRATALSAWLAAHAAQAQVISIEAGLSELPQADRPKLVLPVAQLPQLRQLKLQHLHVSAVGDGIGTATAPLFGGSHAALTGLTRLELVDCTGSLQGLRSCTALQHLQVCPPTSPPPDPAEPGSLVALLEADLPQLQALTSLQLHAAAADDLVLVAAGSRLTRLQELNLEFPACTAAAFKILPSSLTRLAVSRKMLAGALFVRVSPDNTPGLVGLTALQDLTLTGALHVDIALLAMLTGLQSLQLQAAALVTAAGGPTLRVLSTLTQLRHLALPPLDWDPDRARIAPDPVDVAALTALQQLTFLELAELNYELEPGLFPAGTELPQLVQLSMRPWQFSRTATRVVAACPALQQLSLVSCCDPDDLDFEPIVEIPGIKELSCLSGLTQLCLSADELHLSHDEWEALGRLTGLQVLDMGHLVQTCVAGFGHLTALLQLYQLRLLWTPVECSSDEQRFEISNTAPAGSPSNIWSQLPARGIKMLEQCVEALYREGRGFGESQIYLRREGCNRVLEAFWGALQSTVLQPPSLQQQESEELAALRARVRSLEQRESAELASLQAEVSSLRQQVSGLRRELAAERFF